MYLLLGNPDNSVLNKPMSYFEARHIFLDCRGKITLDETVMLGYCIRFITQSHKPEHFEQLTQRDVTVGKNVFIGSFCILYNTTIGDNSIISCGTVIRSRDIPPNVLVEGNPPRVVGVRRPGSQGYVWDYQIEAKEIPCRNTAHHP